MDVTVVIPCFNEERRLRKCLQSIRGQQNAGYIVNVVVVDDLSTDATVAIAREFGATVLTSGQRDIEVSKKIGLEGTSSPLVLFLDADNWLPSDDWLDVARRALLDHPEAIGAQSARFHYAPGDPAANRYCSLYGFTDPVPFYLRVRDRLMATEAVWNLGGRIVADADQYWLLEADAGRLLTFGSQGFLTRTEDAKHYARGRRFYHMDFVYQRVRSGHPCIVLLKQPVGHDGCADTPGFLRKLVRNITLFHRAHDRAFTYNLSFKDKVMVGAVMLTGVVPLVDAFRGFFVGPRDPAWFLHPILCVAVGALYSWSHLRFLVGNIVARSR